jgi:hypothetical protein
MKYGSLSKSKYTTGNQNATTLNRSLKPKEINNITNINSMNIKISSQGTTLTAEKDLTKSVIGTFRPGGGMPVTGPKFKTSKNSRKIFRTF